MKYYIVMDGIEPIGIVDEKFYKTDDFDDQVAKHLKKTGNAYHCDFSRISSTKYINGETVMIYNTENGEFHLELKEIELNQISVEMGVNW